jgi:DNA-binding response OmpR family regulator
MDQRFNLLIIISNNLLRVSLKDQFSVIDDVETVFSVSSVEQATTIIRQETIHCVIIDKGFDVAKGVLFCTDLREIQTHCAIVMLIDGLSQLDGDTNFVDLVDDFLVKPFRLVDLINTINSEIIKYEQLKKSILYFNGYEFRPYDKFLSNKAYNIKVYLTQKENEILSYLLKLNGENVSRQRLLDTIWGYNAGVTTHTLETHIYRLRQKLESDPSHARILITEPDGYKLNM